MEQKDYILREIEKIGLLLRAIIDRLSGKNENLAIILSKPFEQTKEILFNEIHFNLEQFVSLNSDDAKNYILTFSGLNTENIELLSEVLSQLASNEKNIKNKLSMLKKALLLLELCNEKDKTYSLEREKQIDKLKTRIVE